ncbi:M56 family metallopeptidase [Alteromonas ponticola]|uniref:Protein TonB n=1 Tax=Alteromonas ponticola TaxID=2720613 RepID=A0ABX1R0K8_9ALTE|nr:M56 family metallopeptidase [Alteromonas ponticola]NMH60002.1 TonB family protein [Alteromonas ponticola]
MIEWLWQQTLICSLIISAIMLLKPLVIKQMGAVSYYVTWAIVPVYLLSDLLMPTLFSFQSTQLTSYLVTAQSQQQLIFNSLAPHASSLLLFWLTGVIAFAMWIGISHWRMTRLLDLQQQSCISRLNYKSTMVAVMACENVSAPFITRTPAYTIIVPTQFTQLDRTARSLIIRHEMVHMARGDLWWNLVAISFTLAFWFNPLSWIGYREFRHAQELSCDAVVLKSHRRSQQIPYANALLTFAATPTHSMLTSLPYSSKEQLKERIMNLTTSINRPGIVTVVAITLLSITGALQALELSKDHSVHTAPVYRADPVYPAAAVEQNIEGAVTLQFNIEQSGAVSNVNVVAAQPKGLFDQAAIDAVSQWQYQKGAPQSDVLVEIAFALGNDTVKVIEREHEVVQVKRK